MNINSVDSELLVDSGAEVTVISESLYASIPQEKRPELLPPDDDVELEAANNEPIKTIGMCIVDLDVGHDTYQWKVYVACIKTSGILGFDFLLDKDCTLRARKGLKIDDVWVNLRLKGVGNVNTVAVTDSVEIPAYSETVIQCIFDTDLVDHQYAIVEPILDAESLEADLIIGRSLVDTHRTDIGIPVRVMNTSPESLHIFAGTVIGCLSEIEDMITVDQQENTELESYHRTFSVCSIHNNMTESHVSSTADNTSDCKPGVDMSEWSENLCELFHRSSEELNETQSEALKVMLSKHVGTFARSSDDHGRTSVVKHEINTGDARPIKQRPRRPPRAFQGEEEKAIQSQLKAGIIKESTSPWASPMVFVRKKDGTVRPCIDYRKINQLTSMPASNNLPRIDDCLDCLSGAKLFSTLDLQSGYWQIEVSEADRPKTAFVSSKGALYEYISMPFGLCGAPYTFQRCMELVMKGLQWKTLLIYLDDLILYSSSFGEHIERLEEVLQRLGDAGLKLKPSKCDLFKKEVLFLGHVVSQDGVKPDPKKIEAVQEWPIPKNITGVRSFLGFCSYYRRFIAGFATIASPLNRLLEAGQTFLWTDECQTAFDKLKEVLTSYEVMAYPNDEGQFILDTDASDFGVGAALSQVQWCEKSQCEVERPISYASRSLTKPQRRYCTTRKELLAVVTFMKQFRHYLLGRHFIVRTDHSALRWIMSFKTPEDQMARWLEFLSQYDFEISHRAGKRHGNADGLSRRECDPEECTCYDGITVLENLPCGGCQQCIKKHDMWSDFAEVDDVVPLTMKHAKIGQITPNVTKSLHDDVKKCKNDDGTVGCGTSVESELDCSSRPSTYMDSLFNVSDLMFTMVISMVLMCMKNSRAAWQYLCSWVYILWNCVGCSRLPVATIVLMCMKNSRATWQYLCSWVYILWNCVGCSRLPVATKLACLTDKGTKELINDDSSQRRSLSSILLLVVTRSKSCDKAKNQQVNRGTEQPRDVEKVDDALSGQARHTATQVSDHDHDDSS